MNNQQNTSPRKRQVGRCYAEVPTVASSPGSFPLSARGRKKEPGYEAIPTGQDTFQPTPGLISYTEPVLADHDSFCFYSLYPPTALKYYSHTVL